jgi:uroporphyrinogen III methyltransferase/synthase
VDYPGLVAVGVVYLVGAGPGDPALITRRGAELLGRADVVVYDGLVNGALLDLTRPECERIYGGKKRARSREPLTQEAINQLLVDRAGKGQVVVRLKGGDPFVFGRGPEECEALFAAGVRFEVVPGVSAATAVSAYAGIPITARGVSATAVFATGHEAAGKPTSDVDWQALARAGTVVLFMAVRTAADCVGHLIAAGRAPNTPAAAVEWGTTASQRTVVSTLEQLPEVMSDAGIKPPALLIVGGVVELREHLDWYERRPLFGARVVITRSVERAASFAHALADLGAEPVALPVTRLVPTTGDHAEQVAAAISKLADYDWVVFTSANAVRRFTEELVARRLDARAYGGARIACVGPATAAALARRGVYADVVPGDRRDAVGVAEAVLDASTEPTGMRVLFPRAVRGRDEAIDHLRAAGAEVDLAPVYQTEPRPADDPSLGYGLRRLREGAVDVIAFFAPSQVRATWELLGDAAAELVGACRIIAAIGNTTGKALQRAGVRVDVVPSRPDMDVMAQEIAARFDKES